MRAAIQMEPLTLVELLRRRAADTPNQRAYEFLLDGETTGAPLTYADLDRQAKAIAVWLRSCVAAGERALLLYPPGLEYIAAFFGCLYAGVIAVPAYPPQRKRGLPRVQAMAVDSEAAYVLTTTAVQTAVRRLSDQGAGYERLAALQWLNTDTLAISGADEWREPDINDDSLAFLQYTSGSTGTPKGVMVSHGNLLHNERIIQEAFGHTQQEVIVGWLPLYHDMGLIGNVLQPLYLGVPCVLMSPVHVLQKPVRWLSAISRYRATTSGGPNFAYDLCVRQISETQRRSLDLSTWSVAFNGAEPVHPDTLHRFAETFRPCGFRRESFYPCYGLSEATLLVSGGEAGTLPVIRSISASAVDREPGSPGGDQVHELVGCGTVRLDQQIRIVHPELRTQCVDGQVGEVWVSGKSVAQGYWRQEEETSAVFQAVIADTGEGPFLRTGDLGLLDQEELFIVGRLKDLIIIRGRNHYPHDIERTVEESHPVLRPGGGAAFSIVEQGEERVVVVQEVEPRAKSIDYDAAIAAVREAVAHEHDLAVSAVVLIKLGTLPKTSSGKVQRRLCRTKYLARALTVIKESVLHGTPAMTPPIDGETALHDDSERLDTALAGIWGEVLDHHPVRPSDDFFALGGDSLRGLQLLARIQQVHGVEVPLETLFDHSTLGEFVACLATMPRIDGSMPSMPAAPIGPMIRQGALPLSFAQERFWFLEQLSPGSTVNNVPVALRLRGALDVEALRRGLDEIIRRHDILRARFTVQDGRPVQVILPHLHSALPIDDLCHVPQGQRKEEVRRVTNEEARQPFDLATGPLVRGRVVRMGDEDHILSLTLHHIVTDGWSMGILKDELSALYQAFKVGQDSPLRALPFQYPDLVLSQQQHAQSAEFRRQATYWRARLENVPLVLNLPLDYPRPQVQGYRGARYAWTIEAETVHRLHAVGARYRATLFMTLLSAFNVLLFRYSDQADFSVGTPVANRPKECESLIGCFVNTVALRADFSGNPSFAALLAQVRTTVLGAQANQAIPFERLVDELGMARDLSHTPLFQVMFVLEDRASDIRQLGDLEASRMNVSTHTSVFDLTLEMAQRTDGTIGAVFEYSTDLFAESTIARMAGHFQELLGQVIAFPDLPVSELSMLSADERQFVLVECNNTQRDYPHTSCVHELFEAVAARSPNAPALVCEGCTYTYASLNARANQCARYLRAQGVGPEVTVGLCVQRSLEMVIGLLGSLKAGATYVPIDPNYPAERKTAILNDAQPKIILTQGRVRASVPADVAPVLALDDHWAMAENLSNENVPNFTHPDNAAYLLYTSGTTGRPKGTSVTHRALVNHGTAMAQMYGLEPQDRVLQFASVGFDVAVEECIPTWLAGAAVVLRPSEPMPAYSDFHAFIRERNITVLNLPTPYWAGWIEDLEHSHAAMPPALRLVIVGSDKASADDLRRWRRVAGDRVGWRNAYGPTEATVTASMYVPDPKTDWLAMSTVPIGRPISNVELYVLDSHLQPVPVGVPGDLYIGGDGLARGYHRLPALTAGAFLPHPFSRRAGERLYRTGDRARRRLDGNLEFLGRRDEQIKIRGFRVELAEIEHHARRHPEVREARVFLETNASADCMAVLGAIDKGTQEQLLQEVESIPATEAQWLYEVESDAEERRKTVIQRKPEFDVYLKMNKGEFLSPPRPNQRNWLLRRALDEFSDDLLALDDLAKRFVTGSDRAGIEQGWTGSRADYRPSELIIEGQQVMQDWEAPLMKAMADIVTESRGDILEVGFGMGISASYIQEKCPRSHTIIECNRDVMRAFTDWRGKYPDRDIRLVQGTWQEVVEGLGSFDGVFFDTYPASEAEFEEAVINSITFAEAFIPAAARLLQPGGCFTYYTNEIDSFSRRHQRVLFQHFGSFRLSLVRSLLPPDDCHYWWADSMAVVKAVK
jgi:amino acid adenylation domain-containing protein